MTRQRKSVLRFALPLLLTAVYLAAPGVIFQSASAQCNRPGFKLNYGNFPASAQKSIAADFNADGKMDVATSSNIQGTVAVYFGTGTGEFSAPVVYTFGHSIYKTLAADINNDAKLDLVLILESNGGISVRLNNGSGAFGAPVTSSFGQISAYTLRMADLNGDGKSDLVYKAGGGLTVRLGDGLGNFPAASNYPLVTLEQIEIGDFNGDGKPDVATLNGLFTARTLVIFLNDGSGGLVMGAPINLGPYLNINFARQLNGDNKADIVGSSFDPSNRAAVVLLNDGSGGFLRTDYPISPNFMGSFREGEFNGDGKVDLIGGTSDPNPSRFQVMYGNGTGGFNLGESFGGAYRLFEQGDVADFNGDGKSDLVVAASVGMRTFLRTCNDLSHTKRVDFDGDGLSDFAVWRPSNGNWIIDQSASNIRHTQQWGSGSFGDVPVPGDYDGDGKSDFAVFRAPTGVWYVLRSSNLTLLAVQWGTNGDKPVPGDYDADGKTDLAVFRPADGGWYILKSSDNALESHYFGTNGDKPAQADFDNDDKTDIAVFRPSNGHWYMLKSSDGSFSAVHFGISVDKPVPADYDGDGKADIAVYRPGVAFYFLNSWNNSVTAEDDFRYAGTPSATDVPAPMKKGDSYTTFIWRPASTFFGSASSSSSAPIGMSGDIPVVAPYVIE